MAIIPSDEYPGQIAADAAYPLGKARNETAPNDNDGTPLEATWVNDLWGFFQALLAEAGISPSEVPDQVGASDYLNAILSLLNTITPAQITANQNNYAPAGHATAHVERLSSDATRFLSGLSATDVRVKFKILLNVGSQLIGLQHENASSDAANRFLVPGGTTYSMGADDWVLALRDPTSARWRIYTPRRIGNSTSDTAPIVLQANSISLSSANPIHVTGPNGVEAVQYRFPAVGVAKHIYLSPIGLAGQKGTQSWEILSDDDDVVRGSASGCRGKLALNGVLPPCIITRFQVGVLLGATSGGVVAKLVRKLVDESPPFSHGITDFGEATESTAGDQVIDSGDLGTTSATEMDPDETTWHLDVLGNAGDEDDIEWIRIDYLQFTAGVVS
jgi:hypothetical protein